MRLEQFRLTGRSKLHSALPELEPNIVAMEVEALLSEVLRCDKGTLASQRQRLLAPAEVDALQGLLQHRASGAPLAYVIGKREFYSLEFKVSPAVLIPRPETELIVDRALVALKANQQQCRERGYTIVDLGTGSGAIIIATVVSLAEKFGEEFLARGNFFAVDVSPEALEIARENARHLCCSTKITFEQQSFNDKWNFLAPSASEQALGLFLANPPYISDLERLPDTVDKFEPRSALRSGKTGLECHTAILKEFLGEDFGNQAFEQRLAIIEIGQGQDLALSSWLQSHGVAPGDFQFFRDLQQIYRVLEVTK